MISAKENMSRLVGALARMSTSGSASDETSGQLVYGTGGHGGLTDRWERRIVELSDGKPIARIVETLYREELSAGAWAVDIGLWKGLFDQNVLEAIRRLASKGYIYLEPANSS